MESPSDAHGILTILRVLMSPLAVSMVISSSTSAILSWHSAVQSLAATRSNDAPVSMSHRVGPGSPALARPRAGHAGVATAVPEPRRAEKIAAAQAWAPRLRAFDRGLAFGFASGLAFAFAVGSAAGLAGAAAGPAAEMS